MSLSLTLAQQEIREAILKICSRFGDDYWLERDREGGFPHDFHQALAEAGWLGIAKLAMGWPLQLAALATMAWVLSRDQTEIKLNKP